MRCLIDQLEIEMIEVNEKLAFNSAAVSCNCDCQRSSHNPASPPSDNGGFADTPPASQPLSEPAISELIKDGLYTQIPSSDVTHTRNEDTPRSQDKRVSKEPDTREALSASISHMVRAEIDHYEGTILSLDDRISRNETAISVMSETWADTCIPNVPTHNKYSLLYEAGDRPTPGSTHEPSTHEPSTLPKPVPDSKKPVPTPSKYHPKSPTSRPKPIPDPKKPVPKPRKSRPKSPTSPTSPTSRPKLPIKVKIIGSSLVRDMGENVNTPGGVYGCSFPFPGYKAEEITSRLPGCISESDDLVVIFGGTNNIPTDSIATCIHNISELVSEAVRIRPNKPILISEIPSRFDGDYGHKIQPVNDYLDHLTKKHENLFLLCHDLSRTDLNKGGLHFSKQGKSRIGERIRDIAIKIV